MNSGDTEDVWVIDSLTDLWWVALIVICAGYCCWYVGRYWR